MPWYSVVFTMLLHLLDAVFYLTPLLWNANPPFKIRLKQRCAAVVLLPVPRWRRRDLGFRRGAIVRLTPWQGLLPLMPCRVTAQQRGDRRGHCDVSVHAKLQPVTLFRVTSKYSLIVVTPFVNPADWGLINHSVVQFARQSCFGRSCWVLETSAPPHL